MAYKVPTLDEMLATSVALFKALFPDRNAGSRFSPTWKLLKVLSAVATDINANVNRGFRDVMPDTARGAGIDRWLSIFAPGGLRQRKAATPARKADAGRVRGAAGAATSVGDQLIHRSTQLLFAINSNETIPTSGFVDADIAAISTGAQTRLRKGEILEYLSTPAGLKTQVVLQRDLDEDGFDAEQDGSAHNRLLAALAAPSAGGNQSDYVAWSVAQTGVAQAFCYPNRAGLGTVDVAGLHDGTGTARILNAAERASLLAALRTLAPAQLAGPGGALRVLTVVGGNADPANLANVEITLTPSGLPQHAFDWNGKTPPTVASWNAGTRQLQLAAARPPTMQAGHRICLKGVTSAQDGAVVVIEALVGTDTIVLQTVPKRPDGTDAAPAAGDVVYAGGPLTDIVRSAIVAHLNGDVLYAGPNGPLPGAVAASTSTSVAQLPVLALGIGTANPGGVYGAWVGGLLRANLSAIAIYTRGVRNQAVITPATDQEAVDYAFPNDAQIGLLTQGYVLVREA